MKILRQSNTEFKIGDHVIFTDAKTSKSEELHVTRLVRGYEYVVTEVRMRGSASFLTLRGLGRSAFRSSHFTKIDETTAIISVGANVIFLRDVHLKDPDRFIVAEISGDHVRFEKRTFWISVKDLLCTGGK